MRRSTRTTLGVVIFAHAIAGTALAQGASGQLNACTIIPAADVDRISGKPNRLKVPPELTPESDTPKNVSECEYLGMTFSLTRGINPAGFNASRESQKQGRSRIEPAAGVGDEAYYWAVPQGQYSQSGIALRVGSMRLTILDLVPEDSVATIRPMLLALAKAAVPRMR